MLAVLCLLAVSAGVHLAAGLSFTSPTEGEQLENSNGPITIKFNADGGDPMNVALFLYSSATSLPLGPSHLRLLSASVEAKQGPVGFSVDWSDVPSGEGYAVVATEVGATKAYSISGQFSLIDSASSSPSTLTANTTNRNATRSSCRSSATKKISGTGHRIAYVNLPSPSSTKKPSKNHSSSHSLAEARVAPSSSPTCEGLSCEIATNHADESDEIGPAPNYGGPSDENLSYSSASTSHLSWSVWTTGCVIGVIAMLL